MEQVNRNLEEVTSRWSQVKVEIDSIQSMLEEVIAYWTRYNACIDIFTVWLRDAERELERSPADRGVSILRITMNDVSKNPRKYEV